MHMEYRIAGIYIQCKFLYTCISYVASSSRYKNKITVKILTVEMLVLNGQSNT